MLHHYPSFYVLRFVLPSISLLVGYALLPQAHGQFTTMIDAPPTVIRSGVTIDSDTQLNVFEGGRVGWSVNAGSPNGGSVNVEVNVMDGTVGGSLRAHGGSEIHISGGSIGPSFQANGGSVVNITGGLIDHSFLANSGSIVVVAGGSIGRSFRAADGSVVDISGGLIGHNFRAEGGSEIQVSGGSFGSNFDAHSESDLTFVGGEYRLDGQLLPGLDLFGSERAFDLPEGSVLSGTLQDGASFSFSSLKGDGIEDGVLTLKVVELPAVGPAVITAPSDQVPRSIRSGQTLLVEEGSVVAGSFRAAYGSQVNITGGAISYDLTAVGAHVSLSGGEIGNNFSAFGNSAVRVSGGSIGSNFLASRTTVDVSGGSIGSRFRAKSGSLVDLSDGSVGTNFQTEEASVVNMTGGSVGSDALIGSGSNVSIAGGSIGPRFRVEHGSAVHIVGGDFHLDGSPIDGLETIGSERAFELPEGSVMSGTYADGTPFIFSSFNGDEFAEGTLTLQAAEVPPVTPFVFTLPGDRAPLGLRMGQVVVVEEDGELAGRLTAAQGSTVIIKGGKQDKGFVADGATINILGGEVGDSSAFGGSVINFSGGRFGSPPLPRALPVNAQASAVRPFIAHGGSILNVTGGLLGHGFQAHRGSVVNIAGGSVEWGLQAFHGSVVNISGGSIGSLLQAADGGVVNISGGSVGRALKALNGGVVNISRGTVGAGVQAHDGGIVNITGGSVGTSFRAMSGSEVYISGGSVDERFNSIGGSVVISGGSIGPKFNALEASVVHISAGSIGSESGVKDSEFNISGGSIGPNFRADGASRVNMTGGSIGRGAFFGPGSVMSISGGSIGSRFYSAAGSSVLISGGEFRLDDVPIRGVETIGNQVAIQLPNGSVLSGNYADGTPFILSRFNGDVIVDGTLTLQAAEVLPATPTVFTLPGDLAPLGLRNGQVLFIEEGSQANGRITAAKGSEIVVRGGELSDGFVADGAIVSISGGEVGDSTAFNGSVINVSGGRFGTPQPNSQHGSLYRPFGAFRGSIVNISGGAIEQEFLASDGSIVNISGGSIGNRFRAAGGAIVNLFVSEMRIDDVPINLVQGEAFEITSRDGEQLTALLLDGSILDLTLNGSWVSGEDVINPAALLTATLVIPEPASVCLLLVGVLAAVMVRR